MFNNPDRLHFTTRLSLSECKRRLEKREEPTSLMTWRGTYRVRSSVWEHGPEALRFKLSLAPKSALTIQIFTAPVRVEGVIKQQTYNEADVLAVPRVRTISYVANLVVTLVVGGVLGYQLTLTGPFEDVALLLTVLIAAGLTLITAIYFYVRHHLWLGRLYRTVQQALGDEVGLFGE